ncbi:ATP-binding protein [Oligoflexus tunisiensis]|uniref:ATP-binding protein n=1 Tax=Oligoflexus tunisiensis TaxID=708132 RepID=UPI00114CB920|nr:ATP-binding protein [Oligoflexus tunisiensis]
MERIAEERFHPITKLASIICETPIAFISILDDIQEHFLARIGFDVVVLPIEKSICGDVIEQDDVYIVSDIAKDERFSQLQAAIGKPELRFYAGAPLMTHNKVKLGVLCVLDYLPRELNQGQQLSLATLAEHAIIKLEDELIKDELNLAVVRLKTLIDNLNTAIILESEFRSIAAINEKFYELFDIRIENVIGRNVFDLFCTIKSAFKDPDAFMRKVMEYSLSEGTSQGYEIETRNERYLEFSYTPIFVDNEARGLLWIFKDITEKRESERLIEIHKAQLVMSSKMAALGEVAAGIAHEINNPLSIIQSIGYVLKHGSKDSLVRDTIVREAGDRIEQTTKRITRIIKGLLQFAREAEPEQKMNVMIRSVLDDTLSFVQERFQHHGIQLKVEDFDPTLQLHCSPTALSQILINLLSNAFDAAWPSTDKWVTIKVRDIGKVLEIEVSDSGQGIPFAIRDKIMQPFFTTKEVGKGSGLGLSISKGLAEKMGGRLFLSLETPYTSFVLELPKG